MSISSQFLIFSVRHFLFFLKKNILSCIWFLVHPWWRRGGEQMGWQGLSEHGLAIRRVLSWVKHLSLAIIFCYKCKHMWVNSIAINIITPFFIVFKKCNHDSSISDNYLYLLFEETTAILFVWATPGGAGWGAAQGNIFRGAQTSSEKSNWNGPYNCWTAFIPGCLMDLWPTIKYLVFRHNKTEKSESYSLAKHGSR